MDLTEQNVSSVFTDCLFTSAEVEDTTQDPDAFLPGVGVLFSCGLHPDRTLKHTEGVRSMLKQLPDSFNKEGGLSFLAVGLTSGGGRWTDSYSALNQLICLSTALGLGELLRVIYHNKNANVIPYFRVKDPLTKSSI